MAPIGWVEGACNVDQFDKKNSKDCAEFFLFFFKFRVMTRVIDLSCCCGTNLKNRKEKLKFRAEIKTFLNMFLYEGNRKC
jgi:hypothetical protein